MTVSPRLLLSILLLFWVILLTAGCAKEEKPGTVTCFSKKDVPENRVEKQVTVPGFSVTRISSTESPASYAAVKSESRPLLLKGKGTVHSDPFIIAPETALETAFGISGGRFHRPGDPGTPAPSEPEEPVRFRLIFEAEGAGEIELLDEILDAAVPRKEQRWQIGTLSLDRLAGLSGRFRFTIESGPGIGRLKAKPVWAHSLLLLPVTKPGPGRLILVVSADTLRADALGCYGSRRWTSPHIDAFSRQCLLFRNAYATSPWTLPSHVSIMTATYPNVHRLERYNSPPMSTELRTLAELLADNGYLTAAFVDGGFITPFKGFHRGFDIFNYQYSGGISEIRQRAAAWIEAHPGRDLFVFFHFYDVHYPYRERLEGRSFSPDTAPEGYADRMLKDNLDAPDAAIQHLRDLYDNGVVYSDYHFSLFLRQLEQTERYDEALIIFLSDHGEEFREHGRLGHQTGLFQETLAIPLMVKFPEGRMAGERSEMVVSLVDVMPTVLTATGIETPAQSQGLDLLELFQSTAADRTVFGETMIEGSSQAIIDHREKLIHHPGGRLTRYDLVRDPGELGSVRERDSALTRNLVMEHLWKRPGLQLWLGGFSGQRDFRVTIEGLENPEDEPDISLEIPFFGTFSRSAESASGKGVFEGILSARYSPCGLVLAVDALPSRGLSITVLDVSEGRSAQISLCRTGDSVSAETDGVLTTIRETDGHRFTLASETPKPGALEYDLLTAAERPIGVVALRFGPPMEGRETEMDDETRARLQELGYLE